MKSKNQRVADGLWPPKNINPNRENATCLGKHASREVCAAARYQQEHLSEQQHWLELARTLHTSSTKNIKKEMKLCAQI